MAFSPDHRVRRRRERVRRRRRVALALATVLVLAVVGAGIVALNGSHNVVVVRVIKAKQPPRKANTQARQEYPAAAGAPSLDKVRAELAATEGRTPTASASSGARGSVLARGATASFGRLTSTLPGRVELAVSSLGDGSTTVLGADVPAHGWSTTKVPVLVALLRARGARGLSANENLLAHSAITESSNESVLALFGDLERLKGGLVGASRYMQGLFRASGDEETVVATAPPPAGAVTTFGQTEWRPSQAVKFFRALDRGCLLPASQGRYVLDLMEKIVPSESWGLGSAGFGSVAFKGGWGPEPSGAYLVRQSGVIDAGSAGGVAVSIVAFPRSGSFSSGTQILTQTATWLRHELRHGSRASAACS